MIRSPLLRTAGALLAAGLLFSSAQVSAVVGVQPVFSGLNVLGDSLSDSGRLFALSGNSFPLPPYFEGRISNGPVAVEYLASGLGLTGPQFNNLAIAGARTGLNGSADNDIGQATGMLTQLASFQASLGGGSADSNALYMVWGGANDMRDAFVANDVPAGMNTAINNLVTIVSTLHGLGARNFLLPNLPDLGLTPEAREAGGSATASFVSELFNTALGAAYGGLAAGWTDETFYHFDAMSVQRAITLGSLGSGISNVTERCYDTRDPFAITQCATPDTYLYWDNIHPTAAAHQVLGTQMLAAVPEPATVLMMAVGALGLIGLGRRRRPA